MLTRTWHAVDFTQQSVFTVFFSLADPEGVRGYRGKWTALSVHAELLALIIKHI